ncbi:DUF4123 domain-containing protein [Orbaceae bacterium ESL0721]|nr:DUF4123 domain-containing protein [Orbaceae bacterium ESL0721]
MLNEHIAFKTMLNRQKESKQTFSLYALVDGLEYERLFRGEIEPDETALPLFIQTNNRDVAFAGPWLITMNCTEEMKNQIIQLEQTYPSVTWIISSHPLMLVFNHLERKLHTREKDNRYALLRYYDPRVLHKLANSFTKKEREIFTLNIDEWIYSYNNHYYSFKRGVLL